MSRPICCLAGALLSLFARAASAADGAVEEAPPLARRTVLLEGAAGMGAPLGWLGASVVVAPFDAVAIHGGVGIGSQSPQLALGVRGRIRAGARTRLGIGGTWSTGEYAGIEGGLVVIPAIFERHAPIFFWRRAHIINLEGSLEADLGSVVLRPFIGIGYVANDDYGSRTTEPSTYTGIESRGCDCSPFRARIVPFVGFGLQFGAL